MAGQMCAKRGGREEVRRTVAYPRTDIILLEKS
jgi:hypothetical protein